MSEKRPLRRASIWAICAAVLAGGCQGHRPASAPLISHIILFDLREPAEASELLSDCDTYLADINSIETYVSGEHFESGRPMVLSDYDVGLIVGFATPEDYAAYLSDPLHVRLVEKWQSRVEQMRVYDISNPTK